MADISLESLLPSGDFKASLCTGTLTIPSGTSGTLLTVNSTSGRKIRLTMLSVSPTGSESGISVSADSAAVVSSLTLSNNMLAAGSFAIGSAQDSSGRPFSGNVQQVEAFGTIAITKASGSTTGVIYYALEQGF